MTRKTAAPHKAQPRKNAGTKGVPRLDREIQILDVAAAEFGAMGYAATNLAVIADKAGISKPLIYNYFTSKEGLFTACLDRAGAVLADEIERIAREDTTGIERGMRTLDGIFAVLETHPHFWKLFFDGSAPTTGAIGESTAHYKDRITKLAEEGVTELMTMNGNSEPLDISAMTSVWMSTVDALVNWWLDHPDQTAEQMMQRCVRLLTALFAEATS
ncbi:MAG: TetR/AcrR family transcriptional regulator [Actinomycetota bacterium]|nr:TetR/AcrR family transcriptional regulator [Actinomycetota bacterium]